MQSINILKGLRQRVVFFGRKSGIHGLPHLFNTNSNLFSRLFWLSTLIVSMGCLNLMMQRAAQLGVEVNFTPDTRYLHWITTFPGLTVCEEPNIKFALRKFTALYPDLLNPLNYDQRRYLTELLFARGDFSNAKCTSCGETVPCDVPWRTIIEQVQKSCQEMLSECSYNGVEFSCCEHFRSVDSEHGPCFSFNTLQHKGETSLLTMNRTTGPGILTFRLLADAELSIHSPEELSTDNLDMKLQHDINIYRENRVELMFSIVEMVNGDQLQRESIDVRGCRYLHEVPDHPFHTYPVYSYGACRLADSTEQFYRYCGCVHPARDLTYEKIYCNYTGINCWNEFEDLKIKADLDLDFKDVCLPSCVESELTTIYLNKRWVPEEAGSGVLVKVKMVSLPTIRYQRNLLRDNLDLVVAVGGIVGLFFGASILSLLEVFYLFLRPPNYK